MKKATFQTEGVVQHIRWVLRSGSTPSSYTGPNNDGEVLKIQHSESQFNHVLLAFRLGHLQSLILLNVAVRFFVRQILECVQ